MRFSAIVLLCFLRTDAAALWQISTLRSAVSIVKPHSPTRISLCPHPLPCNTPSLCFFPPLRTAPRLHSVSFYSQQLRLPCTLNYDLHTTPMYTHATTHSRPFPTPHPAPMHTYPALNRSLQHVLDPALSHSLHHSQSPCILTLI